MDRHTAICVSLGLGILAFFVFLVGVVAPFWIWIQDREDRGYDSLAEGIWMQCIYANSLTRCNTIAVNLPGKQ